MTNIQAIDLLKGLEQSLDDYYELNDEGKTVFRMAITALEVFGIYEQLPSAQPEPCEDAVRRMRGQWINQPGGGCCCSVCGRVALNAVDGNLINVCARSNFCPSCGADMRGEV